MNATTIIIYIAAAALIVYAVYQTIQKFRGKAKSSCCGTPEVKSIRKVDDTDESHYPYRYTVKVDGMKCSGCAANVESSLNNLDGVWARVNLGKHEAKVLTKTERSREDFENALAGTSYKVNSVN
ncbi:MAG: heavy-metal-associated domain-containing protein [Firmicutes bacterium]|jgi:copper chaperone CopZ|nr:heavy-metal-associated domain-containing protein [Bacillota bacterium]